MDAQLPLIVAEEVVAVEAAAGIVVVLAQGHAPGPEAASAIAGGPTAVVAHDHAPTARVQEESHARAASPRKDRETVAPNQGTEVQSLKRANVEAEELMRMLP